MYYSFRCNILKANYDILFGRNTSKHVRCEVISCDQEIHNLGQTQTYQEHHTCLTTPTMQSQKCGNRVKGVSYDT